MTGSRKEWDVIVAGAGPAGCALAAKLSGAGAHVLVLERAQSPGDGREWIVDIEKSAFEQASVPVPALATVWCEPERQYMLSSDRSHRMALGDSPLLPVRNRDYVRQLATWAESEGASFATGYTVLGPLLESGGVAGVRCRQDKETVELGSYLVADCTGIDGAVRRGTPAVWGLGERVAAHDIVLARRDVRAVRREDRDAALAAGLEDRVRLDRLGAKGTYSTETLYLDLEQQFIDILIGVKSDPSLPTADEMFNGLLREWPFVGELRFGGGGPIPIRRPWDALVGEGLMVLGDSACQVIPAHGSGTASALIAADLASVTALEALERRRYDRATLWPYSHAFLSGRGARLAYYYVLRVHAERLEVRHMDELLRKGLLTADQVKSGLLLEQYRPAPRAVPGMMARGLSSLPLVAGVGVAGLRAERVARHYRRYPVAYHPGEVQRWVARLHRLL